ncbi:hypothetical protein FS749_000358 [Ceratobasidium sp. UAMH 11750]|nr:hypothetical protein FS749_000358 [Ceratobasidium sp. UAMH 11750]
MALGANPAAPSNLASYSSSETTYGANLSAAVPTLRYPRDSGMRLPVNRPSPPLLHLAVSLQSAMLHRFLHT